MLAHVCSRPSSRYDSKKDSALACEATDPIEVPSMLPPGPLNSPGKASVRERDLAPFVIASSSAASTAELLRAPNRKAVGKRTTVLHCRAEQQLT